jgi:hypothetical protein
MAVGSGTVAFPSGRDLSMSPSVTESGVSTRNGRGRRFDGKIGGLTTEGVQRHFSPARALVEGAATAAELVLPVAAIPYVEELTNPGNSPRRRSMSVLPLRL